MQSAVELEDGNHEHGVKQHDDARNPHSDMEVDDRSLMQISEQEQRQARTNFHLDWFNHARRGYWLGYEVWKCPLDLFSYQEIIVERRPELIIECGTYAGGSALFMACMCDYTDVGRVVTVDEVRQRDLPEHPRIDYINGDDVSNAVLAELRGYRDQVERCMVVLDSNHKRGHVARQLKLYSEFVSVGDYLIVEDTNVNGHPVLPEHGPGPWEAVGDFLERDDRFRIDPEREHFILSFNPGGYLLRVA